MRRRLPNMSPAYGARAAGSTEASPRAGYNLGAELATKGPRATRVFAASSRVAGRVDARTEVVVTDTAKLASRLRGTVAAVALSELAPSASVPAFDPETNNPIGWRPAHGAALAPTSRPTGPGSGIGVAEMRGAHHVEDWTADRDDPAVRAGELAAAAAAGAVVRVLHGGPELESCLGSELYGLMTGTERIERADSHQREALSIAMRRAALRDHSLRARARQVLAAAGLGEPGPRLVSVLVPTRRPDRLANIVDTVAAQTYPCLELVLALHGEGFEHGVEHLLERLPCPARAVNVAADRSLGEVLNAGLDASRGAVIAKIDDDDIYGPHHLWDLVLAAEYSGAALVGKVSEYVYLAGADRTVRRFAGLGERFIDPARAGVAGAAAMIDRRALDAIGGWRRMGVGEDRALAQEIAASGARVYRTHGAGFLAVRHGVDHTWQADDSYFLEQAQGERGGCDLGYAGIA